MKWTISKIISILLICGGLAYGFIKTEPNAFQAMIMLCGMGTALIGGKTYLQDKYPSTKPSNEIK